MVQLIIIGVPDNVLKSVSSLLGGLTSGVTDGSKEELTALAEVKKIFETILSPLGFS